MADIAEAERELVTADALTTISKVQLRSELERACVKLLPTAIAEAAPAPLCPHCHRTASKGSTALLRLISRVAMREYKQLINYPKRRDRP